MTTAKSYVDTVAPYPKRSEDVTAIAMAKAIACRANRDDALLFSHYYLHSPFGDRQAARDFGLLASRSAGYHGVRMLLQALIEHAPDKADQVARNLWECWDDGELSAELTADWLVENGVDPERISAEAEPVTRATA